MPMIERAELKEENVDVVIIRYEGDNVTGELKVRLEGNIADVYSDGSIAVKNPDCSIDCIRHNGRWLRKEAFDEYVDAIKNRISKLKEQKNED